MSKQKRKCTEAIQFSDGSFVCIVAYSPKKKPLNINCFPVKESSVSLIFFVVK